jgi:F0F1-type ATP synthase membrane subunit c/vacuolar-type H+-ATPase subunit K
MGTQLVTFVLAQLGLLVLGINDAFAQTGEVVTVVNEISTGMGLAIIGAGIPTALSTIGAGIAVGPIGAASLAGHHREAGESGPDPHLPGPGGGYRHLRPGGQHPAAEQDPQ